MKLGILCAGDEELEPYLERIESCTISEKALLKFYEGTVSGINVVMLFCGGCKVNAAIAAQILIDTYKVDAIINSGVAGGIHSDLKVFDIVVSTETVYHDVAPNILTEFHPYMKTIYFESDKRLLESAKLAVKSLGIEENVFYGRMATGEAFISDDGRQEIIDNFAPLTVDMETASIVHVCYVNAKSFISVRCITDTASKSASEDFSENCPKASALARDVVVAMINELAW